MKQIETEEVIETGLHSILLNIITVMKDGSEEDQELKLVTEGKMGERNGHRFLMYEESELTGMKGSKSTLKLEPGKVTLIRYGEVATKMEFIEKEIFMTTYQTPYGVFDMILKTGKITEERAIDHGHLHMEYQLEISGGKTQHCRMEIDYKLA